MFVFRRDPDADLGVGVAFTSAALALGDGQPAEDRAAAYGRLTAALGVPVAVAAQVHGADVLDADAAAAAGRAVVAPASGLVDLTDHRADALLTTRPGLGVAVRVADCVPICLAASDGSAVAAVHAGRAGLLSGVIGAAVAALRARTDADLLAWVGPHVCGACYEVPDAMAVDAAAHLGVPASRTRWGTAGIDLGAATRRQLEAHGVAVEEVGACTLESDALPSHRGGVAPASRMVGVVWRATRPDAGRAAGS